MAKDLLAKIVDEDRFPEPAPAPQSATRTSYTPPSRVGTKPVTTHLTKVAYRNWKSLCLDLERSTQSLLVEAINDLLHKYHRPPIS